MKNKVAGKGNVIYNFMVILFALLLFLGISNTVAGKEENEESQSAYYHELEERFQNVLQEELQRDGYRDCGITISSITVATGARSYQVLLHHHKFAEMTGEERAEVLAGISEITFPDQSCQVTYDIFL